MDMHRYIFGDDDRTTLVTKQANQIQDRYSDDSPNSGNSSFQNLNVKNDTKQKMKNETN